MMIWSYQATERQLETGDMVILTSDGVVEAKNPSGEMLGFTRLTQAIESGPLNSPRAMLDHLRHTVETFAQGEEPHDDATIVVVRV